MYIWNDDIVFLQETNIYGWCKEGDMGRYLLQKYEYQMDVMDYLWGSYDKGTHNITPAVDTEDIIQVNMDG